MQRTEQERILPVENHPEFVAADAQLAIIRRTNTSA
jgi:hypothetical protein